MKRNRLIQIIREEFDNITIDDIPIDTFSDSSDVEYMFDQYKADSETIDFEVSYDEYLEDEAHQKDFEDWLKYEFEYRLNEQKQLYETLFRNGSGRMTIFRAMKVSKEWIKSLTKPNAKLGIFWAYEEDAAEAHWGDSHKGRTETAVLQTSVTENQIDWIGTFEANLHPSIGEEEREIRLKEGEKIPLEALSVNNKEIKLNKTIKSNIYLA